MSKNRLVVGDASWADTIPKWLLDEIKEERMIYGLASIMKPDRLKVGDAELVAYLMTASLRAPIGRDYTEIYTYLTAKLMKRRGVKLPEDMQQKLDRGLDSSEEWELKQLREDIYRARGGDIDHPLLNTLRAFKKDCQRESDRLKKTGQPQML